MIQLTAQLLERRAHGASQELRLHAPELARQLSPGQAVLVRAGWGLDPYLRRAFYPVALDEETWTLRLPPSGDWGHAWLRTAPLGTQIDCLGPVGHGYKLNPGFRNLLCVGQGEAAWTLLLAVAQADALGMAVTFAMAGSSPRDLIPPGRLPAAVEYRLVTIDGSRAAPGLPERLLIDLLGWADAVLAAGPLNFYSNLAEATKTARYGLSREFVQVLYPAAFLCGAGACQACVADLVSGRRRVCLRGPVFDLLDIVI